MPISYSPDSRDPGRDPAGLEDRVRAPDVAAEAHDVAVGTDIHVTVKTHRVGIERRIDTPGKCGTFAFYAGDRGGVVVLHTVSAADAARRADHAPALQ